LKSCKDSEKQTDSVLTIITNNGVIVEMIQAADQDERPNLQTIKPAGSAYMEKMEDKRCLNPKNLHTFAVAAVIVVARTRQWIRSRST
jgi:hypothetical protein